MFNYKYILIISFTERYLLTGYEYFSPQYFSGHNALNFLTEHISSFPPKKAGQNLKMI